MQIRDWCVTVPNLYRAPECRGRPTIAGVRPDGKRIVSSAVVEIDGCHVITQSGSHYELVGPPHERWLAEMREANVEADVTNPLKDWI